jgi:hypothetical protein
MIEDAVVIYTMTRAPDRRVFYIDVGNLPKVKAEQYVTDIMNKFKNKLIYNASTGEIADSKRNLCLSMDTKIPLMDGRVVSLADIAAERASGKELWAYSCDPITGKFAPGLITWAGVTIKDSAVMRITLDNGKTITCTDNHKFPVWNKGKVEAKDLVVGESMVPFYSRLENIIPGSKYKDYQQIYENDSKKWTFTHRLVSIWKDENTIENEYVFDQKNSGKHKRTVHHKNFTKLDNSPSNLIKMNRDDHNLLHSATPESRAKFSEQGKKLKLEGRGIFALTFEQRSTNGKISGAKCARDGISQANYAIGRKKLALLMADPEWNTSFREKQREGWTDNKKQVASGHAKTRNLNNLGNAALAELWKTPEYRLIRAKKYKTEYTNEMLNIVECGFSSILAKQTLLDKLNSDNIIETWSYLNKDKCSTKVDFSKIIPSDLDRMVQYFGFNTYTEACDSVHFRNHKITAIEYLDQREDVGCLTIDGDELYHNYHTFALDAGIYTGNSMTEDFWLARRDSKSTEITTLQGSQSLIQSDFIDYFQNKLYQSLNVPIGRLKPETGFTLGRSSEVTRDELKFSKFVGRLRIRFSGLFSDLMKIQLVSKGLIRLDEWDDIRAKIRFDFIKDNHFTELKNAEIITNRMTTLQMVDPFLGKYVSKKWVQKNILMLDDEEIVEMEKQIKEDGPIPGTEEMSAIEPPAGDEEDPTQDQEMDQSQEAHDQKIRQSEELHQQKLKDKK